MKFFIILSFAIIAGIGAQLSFEEWEAKFAKKLEKSRLNFYRASFIENLKEIEAHNAKKNQNFKMDINEFSHLPPREFISTRCKTVVPKNLQSLIVRVLEPFTADEIIKAPAPVVKGALTVPPSNYPFYSYTILNVPPEVDWSGLMQPVQNQGYCGACWAFSTMGLLEGMLNIRKNFPPDYTNLSPQYLIDCVTSESGCEGGWPATALRYLRSTTNGNDAPKSADYPYMYQRMSCNRMAPRLPLNITKVTEKYFSGNELALQAQVTNYGPTIVAMYAPNNLALYKSGVYSNSACPTGILSCDNVNHAVVVVGFGTDPVVGDYWKVKNSWGATWGDNGYFLIARNKNNMCNIACWGINAW